MLLAAQSILQVKTGADIINAPLPPVHPMTPPTMTVDLKTRQFLSQRLGALLCCEETANGESKTKSSESIVTLHVVVPPSPRRNGSS